MSLVAGAKLGSYEILSGIGAGGMGEVYRARDTKLEREVAIKVLPEAFAQDIERLTRFEREARLLASVNHPNIATIHGLEQSGEVRFLVMELVPGETLAEQVKRSAIPMDEAVPLFVQLAEALEAAHEKGVIHRDLKPANIKLTPEGKVKVLDFGLAKASVGTASGDSSQSPTLSRAATEAGVILGTAGYMSPEQARGKTVDKTTDIWAFGCCLYEALSGRMAFKGDTLSDTIASVLTREPGWEALPKTTPRGLRRLLQRCLQKDSRRRFRDAGDVRIELEEALREEPTPATEARTEPVFYRWVAVGALALGVGLAIWSLTSWRATSTALVTRLRLSIPPLAAQEESGHGYRVAISPDGSRLAVLNEGEDGTTRIFVRDMGELDARPVEGTEGAEWYPFFSPDGDWIGFFSGNKLKKVSIAGGRPVTLCDAPGWPGAKWGSDRQIYFGPGTTKGDERGRGVFWVPETGGIPQVATKPAGAQISHWLKDILPGGNAALVAVEPPNVANNEDWQIGAVSLKTGEYQVLIEKAAFARYSPSGHLLFARGGTLFAAPFDVGRRKLTGPPAPLVEGLAEWAEFVLSDNGTLAWVPATDMDRKLVWVDRAGASRAVTEERRAYEYPRISPDGGRIAVGIYRDGNRDIWLYDVARGTMTRLTLAPSDEEVPVWTPDGQRVAFVSTQDGPVNLYWKRADGSGTTERLAEAQERQVPLSWSPDGKVLAFYVAAGIATLSMEGERKATPFLFTPAWERAAALSPDGRWLAYNSDESGRQEVYVNAYPGPGARFQVSIHGGMEPLWAPDGKEIFFRSVTDRKIMAVPVRLSPEFVVGQPTALFDDRFDRGGGVIRNYDITPDGRKFLMVEARQSAPTELLVVLNWFEELKRLVPVY
jgi:serine/threonine-protein kinase